MKVHNLVWCVLAVSAAACGAADSSTSGDDPASVRAENEPENAPNARVVAAAPDHAAARIEDTVLAPWSLPLRPRPNLGEILGGSSGETASGTTPDAGPPSAAAPSSSSGASSSAGESSTVAEAGDAGSVPTYVGLHAVGGNIVDAYGSVVRLHGVNRSGSEFACVGGYGFFDGPTDAASVAAMKAWNINAVRVPLNEDCWLGINGVSSTYGGANYQQAIVGYVNLLVANGIYPIVDLHWSAPGTTLATQQQPMADADHAPAFWTSVATTFRYNGAVILELFNEPWPDNNQDTNAAWKCWKNGGSCPSIPYEVAGMQTLVDAVRATGSTNFVLLGGVEYSNGLTQWATHKPSDPLNNLGAAWHVYEGNTCSDTTCFDQIAAPLANLVPIVATEIGDDTCDSSYMQMVMQWLDQHGQSYSAWTWNAWGSDCSNYSLINDYTGTPNGSYGSAVQTHYLAQ